MRVPDGRQSATVEWLASDYSDHLHGGSALHTRASTAMTDWISVEDRLPEASFRGLSEPVLVYGTKGIDLATYWHTESVWMPEHSGAPLDSVTHWMPLPEPPEAD